MYPSVSWIITPDGQRTILMSNLNRPTPVLVTSDGTVYHTTRHHRRVRRGAEVDTVAA